MGTSHPCQRATRYAWFAMLALALSGCLRYQFVAPPRTAPEQWESERRECLDAADAGHLSYNNLPTAQLQKASSMTDVDAYIGCMRRKGYRFNGEEWSLSSSDTVVAPPPGRR